tara:strand:+ start:12851 stop:13399 length:549 start_codon:yes stop_codon:yes gene_type:complete
MPHTLGGMMTGALGEPRVQEIVLYPVSEDVTGEIDDDGVTPVYRPATAHSTNAASEGTAEAAWTETINFEQQGSISIISAFYEFEWRTEYTDGGGSDASYSKVQISGDGGSNWSDLTDNFQNTTTGSTTSRIRAAVSNVLTSVSTGTDQLQMRLVHWVTNASDTSEAHVRTNSYVRFTYRKS